MWLSDVCCCRRRERERREDEGKSLERERERRRFDGILNAVRWFQSVGGTLLTLEV